MLKVICDRHHGPRCTDGKQCTECCHAVPHEPEGFCTRTGMCYHPEHSKPLYKRRKCVPVKPGGKG